ncbi:MAG: hypothetical protein OEN50_15675 [Deltaproteobacteria bacterium]|nr:hypothetical protein [Deltaproteobacteria bacterium]
MNIKTFAGFFSVIVMALAFASLAVAYEEIQVSNGATLRGVVRVEGKLPKLPPLQISKYKEICKSVPNENLIMGPKQGLRNAIVTIEGIKQGKAIEKESQHELDNAGCRFVPRVQVASVGQFVVLKNSDPILHTAHAFFAGAQPQFNVGLYPGRVIRKPLVAPGLVQILCEVHPWMNAYIMVNDHPYHAVTDLYGEYLISDIPPGEYQLRVWHESLGAMEKKISVKAGESSSVEFVYTPTPGVKK